MIRLNLSLGPVSNASTSELTVMEYLCHKWPQIGSNWCYHNSILFINCDISEWVWSPHLSFYEKHMEMELHNILSVLSSYGLIFDWFFLVNIDFSVYCLMELSVFVYPCYLPTLFYYVKSPEILQKFDIISFLIPTK